jgi:hypothetical protein
LYPTVRAGRKKNRNSNAVAAFGESVAASDKTAAALRSYIIIKSASTMSANQTKGLVDRSRGSRAGVAFMDCGAA